ncbi:hypothetical protein OVA24_16825 [Luteolibacter sp. SL250]|uniref:immunity protein TriTu family protein n=1 Tax=Luteolibacter sp. SL250 TaxID=2995170 RepID=UPI00226EFE21|nr:hypothetical protein [Luteolibacter sp. SL250]WAC18897.1 hypothetical protein OVA24_16825 [Luteolibacter sp. SL250]
MSYPESFTELVSRRGFERYQDALIARWKAHRIDYRLTYGLLASKPAMHMDFDTAQAVGRVSLWESGECDLEVLDAESGNHLLLEHHEFSTPEEFFETYARVPLLLRKIRGDELP